MGCVRRSSILLLSTFFHLPSAIILQPSIGVYDYYDKEQRFLLQHQLGKHHECYDQGGDAENYQ